MAGNDSIAQSCRPSSMSCLVGRSPRRDGVSKIHARENENQGITWLAIELHPLVLDGRRRECMINLSTQQIHACMIGLAHLVP